MDQCWATWIDGQCFVWTKLWNVDIAHLSRVSWWTVTLALLSIWEVTSCSPYLSYSSVAAPASWKGVSGLCINIMPLFSFDYRKGLVHQTEVRRKRGYRTRSKAFANEQKKQSAIFQTHDVKSITLKFQTKWDSPVSLVNQQRVSTLLR